MYPKLAVCAVNANSRLDNDIDFNILTYFRMQRIKRFRERETKMKFLKEN